MIELTMEMVSPDNMPKNPSTTEGGGRFGGDVQAYVDWLYDNSIYANREKLESYLAGGGQSSRRTTRPSTVFNTTVAKHNGLGASAAVRQFAEGHKLYIKGLLEMDADGNIIPTRTSPSVSPTATLSCTLPRMPWITTTSPR